MKPKACFVGLLFVIKGLFLQSQTIITPNYSLKSHETLNILKIDIKPEATIFYLSIENQRTGGGSFCADKNIFVIYPDGKRIRLNSSSGIPVCPETHKFKEPGEKLEFSLTFARLKSGTKWIDLIEDCRDNCFSFYGITLNDDLNSRIDYAFSLADKGEQKNALMDFVSILEDIDKNNQGIKGLLYINIIKLARETGDNTKAEEWYKKFKLSGVPRLSEYLKFLTDQGITY